MPVLGLIFLRYADFRFAQIESELGLTKAGRRTIGKTDYQARGVLYLPEAARFSALMQLTKGDDVGKPITGRHVRGERRLRGAAQEEPNGRKLEELNEALETLNAEARQLEDRIAENVAQLLENA